MKKITLISLVSFWIFLIFLIPLRIIAQEKQKQEKQKQKQEKLIFSADEFQNSFVRDGKVLVITNNQDKLSYKVHNLPHFLYNGTYYPIVDDTTRKYFGDEKYAKSFSEWVKVDSSKKSVFSPFLFQKSTTTYYDYLETGRTIRNVKGETTTKSAWIEFFLAFIFLPFLIYLFLEDKKIGSLDFKSAKGNGVTFLLIGILSPISSSIAFEPYYKETLRLIPNSFMLAASVLYFVASLVSMLILDLLFSSFQEFEEEDLPTILLGSTLAGIFYGLFNGEMTISSLLFIVIAIMIGIAIFIAIDWLIDIVKESIRKNMEREDEIINKILDNARIEKENSIFNQSTKSDTSIG